MVEELVDRSKESNENSNKGATPNKGFNGGRKKSTAPSQGLNEGRKKSSKGIGTNKRTEPKPTISGLEQQGPQATSLPSDSTYFYIKGIDRSNSPVVIGRLIEGFYSMVGCECPITEIKDHRSGPGPFPWFRILLPSSSLADGSLIWLHATRFGVGTEPLPSPIIWLDSRIRAHGSLAAGLQQIDTGDLSKHPPLLLPFILPFRYPLV